MKKIKKIFIALFFLPTLLTLNSCSLLNGEQEQKIENNSELSDNYRENNKNNQNNQDNLLDYENKEHNFSFKYPKNLQIKFDKNNIDEFSPSEYWRIIFESDNLSADKSEDAFENITSGYRASIDIDPKTKIKDFEELKMLSKLGSGGMPVEREEYPSEKGIDFIIQYHQENKNKNVSRTVFTLFNGLFFRMNVHGEFSEEDNIDNFISDMINSFSV